MHELGIAQEMLKVAVDHAARNHAARIVAFNIQISAAADESEDSLRFHLENLIAGTIAEGARIDITRVAARAMCLECGNEFELDAPNVTCPRCSSTRVSVARQDEFKLASIDVE